MIDSGRLSYLGEALRALLVLEVRVWTWALCVLGGRGHVHVSRCMLCCLGMLTIVLCSFASFQLDLWLEGIVEQLLSMSLCVVCLPSKANVPLHPAAAVPPPFCRCVVCGWCRVRPPLCPPATCMRAALRYAVRWTQPVGRAWWWCWGDHPVCWGTGGWWNMLCGKHW
jgi:hypothetical protein